jgi:hypothetical protein
MIVFPLIRFGLVEGGDGVIEGRDVANVRPQSSVPHPLDDLTQLGRSNSTTKSTARPSGLVRPGGTLVSVVGPTEARPAVAIPVCGAEHPLSHRQPRRAIAEGG